MKKSQLNLIFLLFVCCCTCTVTTAQSKLSISVKPELALPISDFGSTFKTGYGGHVQVVLRGTERTNLTASLGYLTFKRKNFLYNNKGSIVPLKIGVQTFIARPIFLAGEAGAAFSSGQLGKDPYYGFSAGPGVSFDLNKSIVSLAANYNIFFLHGTNIQWIGITAAYGLKL
jgi:hypothetical protein